MSTEQPPAAAEIAHALSECMNLLFLFAAPRVLDTVQKTGAVGLDGPTSLASLRRFLRHASAIRVRAAAEGRAGGDVERLVQAAILVEEIAGTLGAQATLGTAAAASVGPLPAAVVDRARRAVAILGFEEPAGGWDAFEGFAVPYPPPAPGAPQ
jgi:hypothetical protein